jgi:hypothetical protein
VAIVSQMLCGGGIPYKDKAAIVKRISTALVASPAPNPMASNLRESERMDCCTRGFYSNGKPDRLIPAPNRLPGWGAFFGVQLNRQPVITRDAHHVRNHRT